MLRFDDTKLDYFRRINVHIPEQLCQFFCGNNQWRDIWHNRQPFFWTLSNPLLLLLYTSVEGREQEIHHCSSVIVYERKRKLRPQNNTSLSSSLCWVPNSKKKAPSWMDKLEHNPGQFWIRYYLVASLFVCNSFIYPMVRRSKL